jgi:flagellum-specific ATP synthase
VTDKAIDLKDAIDGFLKQRPEEAIPGPDADDLLLRTVGYVGTSVGELAAELGQLDDDALSRAQTDLTALPAPATGPSAIPPLNLAV